MSLILAIGIWLPAQVISAAALQACPIVGPSVVEVVLGQQTDVVPLPGVPAGMDACDIVAANNDDYTVVRENAVLAYGAPLAPGALAVMFFPQLTDDTVAQINAVDQPGTSVSAPGFEVSTIAGLGDTAVVVHTVPATMVSILVRRGMDAFMFQTDDLGARPAQLASLAQAVLVGGTPSVTVAGATASATSSAPAVERTDAR